MASPTELQARLADLMKSYIAASIGDKKDVAREIARVMLRARSMFLDAHGRPDFEGTTAQYRQWLRDAYRDTALTPKEVNRALSAGRQRIDEVLDEEVEAVFRETLQRDGRTAAQRKAEARRLQTRATNITSGEVSLTTAREAVVTAQLALRLVARLREWLQSDEGALEASAHAPVVDLVTQLAAEAPALASDLLAALDAGDTEAKRRREEQSRILRKLSK